MPKIQGFCSTHRLNKWDSLLWCPSGRDDFPGGPLSSVRLFGNAHIGEMERCNLLIPGQLGSEASWRVENWYARLAVENRAVYDTVRAFFDHVIVTVVMGDKPQWQVPMSDLLRATPWVPPERDGQPTSPEEDRDERWRAKHGANPIIIPPRQNISANVEFYNDAAQELFALSHHYRFMCWVHLEGVERRSSPGLGFTWKDDPVYILRQAVHDDALAMEIVASWRPPFRKEVRQRLHEQDRIVLARMVADSDAARRRAAPSVGVAVDDLDD